ncbi:response regulator [Desulfosarcina widdelii]|uniref:Response regulator n=1 Tax=Desulfosarcina widdelii TaxID=947919 RepID=A0A5K7Z895_9BACT|nr:response regulator [Desulfosarcina widdelii]BBO76083.1 response regulator [Desulfosarcina widdelii]
MRILLIDDEPIALTKLELMLTNAGTCDTAGSGVEATEYFVKAINDNRPYDLVTIDIELPDITGLDLLNRFVELEHKNGITAAKKIMVTAHSNVDFVVKAKDKCDAFVVKPLRKATLLAKIQELFQA